MARPGAGSVWLATRRQPQHERINSVVVLRPDDKTLVKPTEGPRLTRNRVE
jgi:hypothetical protein